MAKEQISALFLTKYSREGASSRYRFLQYFPFLEAGGIACAFSPLTDAKYLEHLYAFGRGRAGDFARSLFRRLGALRTVAKYDVVVIEYEILPYFPPIFENMLRKALIPYIVNYDDAVFYRYSLHPNALVKRVLGGKIDAVMRSADLVLAGNDYLADYARKAGARRTEVLPTVVDLVRYPGLPAGRNDTFTIGWIGSPTTTKYLEEIAPALAEVCASGRAKLVLIGSGPVKLPGVPVEVRPWSEDREVSDLESCDAGIMPLDDGLWERGKCGLKLVQYMACGLPVVVSPVGMNSRLVQDGVNGFLAKDTAGWVKALAALRDDRALRQRMGQLGRKIVEAEYSLQVAAPRLAELIRQVAGPPRKRIDNIDHA
jgi:glycosyltransferase involved in cell wall biosynthesis